MQRVKNTVACEACRKRKGKCSGTLPCTACQKNGGFCEFRTDQQRRGPRPKAKGPPLIEKNQSAPPIRSASPIPADEISLPIEPLEEQEEHDAISLATWSSCRDDLRAIIDVDRFRTEMTRITGEDVVFDVLCHLLELFWTHVHNHQWPILTPHLLYQAIKTRKCPSFLCLAICASSYRFSSHPALRELSGSTSLDKTFALLAREQLYNLQNQNLARVQSLCILILHDASMSQGGRAWADIAFAKAAIDIVLSFPENCSSQIHELDMARTFIIAQQHLHAIGHPSLSGLYRNPPSLLRNGTSTNDATYLLEVLLRVHEYSNELESLQDYPAPWKSDSTFQNLWRELETFRLRNPDKVNLHYSLFEQINMPSNILAISLLSSLEWHCSVIILHRHLLAHVSSWVGASALTVAHSMASGPTLFSTPSSSFVKEHMKIGISSTLAVVTICAHIKQCGSFFLPPFLAYTCFQSAIFLINALRCGLQDSDRKIEQILKINFAVLSMASDVYAPANAWIETLEILREAPESRNGEPSPQIPEPAFVPLNTCSPKSAHKVLQQATLSQINSSDPKNDFDLPDSTNANDESNQNSLLDYQWMLDEDIENAAPRPSTRMYESVYNSAQPITSGTEHDWARNSNHQDAMQFDHSTTSAAEISPGSSTATISIPRENQFISSLPAELLDSASFNLGSGFELGVDGQFLEMIFETDKLASSSLSSVDLDAMQLWTAHLHGAEES